MNVTRNPRRLVTFAAAIVVAIAAGVVAAITTNGGSSKHRANLTLRVLNTSSGKMVVTASGLTAYIYLPDQTHPSVTTCTGDCAHDWPPILANGDTPTVAGISKTLIGLVTRPDGAPQVTFNGYPLYRFAADRRAGDVRGESVGETWFAIDPTGNFLPLSPVGFRSTAPRAHQSVQVVSTAAGQLLADADGQTLYTYRDDTPTSTACTAAWCLQDWPPLLITRAPTIVSGINAPLGVLHQADGAMQLTAAGHPLYTFSGDERPGDVGSIS
ncbi:MAG TPA: hypothetical protein VFZ97_00985 [Acidimicrobiales bacterium]